MPRYYINDFDEKLRYIDMDGNAHDIPLRNLTVEQLLAVVKIYRLKREAAWNESTLTERLRAAMPSLGWQCQEHGQCDKTVLG
jgi:hypothetical protein